ncbi:MAG: PaaI family thioesterase [Candidatus Xenobia bacterium]
MELPAHRECFGCGEPEDDRITPTLTWDASRQAIVGSVHFGHRAQGPPGHVHGGCLATVLDEAMGASSWLSGHPCLAASLQINYRQMVPLGVTLQMEARVIEVNGRKVRTSAELRDTSGQVVAEGHGLFVKIERDHFDNLPADTRDHFHRWMQGDFLS